MAPLTRLAVAAVVAAGCFQLRDRTAGGESSADVPGDAYLSDAGGAVDSGAVDAAPKTDGPASMDAPKRADRPASMDAAPRADVAGGSPCPAGAVLVPAGGFRMGDEVSLNAQPPHNVALSAFCIDVTEVTGAAYRSCAAAGCTSPASDIWCNWGVTGRESHPINCVGWSQARAYCRSTGGDLPTEAQWEYAARGTDGRAYPWGDAEPSSQICWNGVVSHASTCPVRSNPGDVSPFGVFDMAGNVDEWVSDYHASYSSADVIDPTGPSSGGARVVRGGAWNVTSATGLRATHRGIVAPSNTYYHLGFRCAYVPWSSDAGIEGDVPTTVQPPGG